MLASTVLLMAHWTRKRRTDAAAAAAAVEVAAVEVSGGEECVAVEAPTPWSPPTPPYSIFLNGNLARVLLTSFDALSGRAALRRRRVSHRLGAALQRKTLAPSDWRADAARLRRGGRRPCGLGLFAAKRDGDFANANAEEAHFGAINQGCCVNQKHPVIQTHFQRSLTIWNA